MMYFFSNINFCINRTANIILFIYGGFQVLNNKLSIGEFIIIKSYFNILLSCTSYFLNLGKDYQQSLVSYSRLREILDEQLEHNGTLRINNIESIELKDIEFYHDGSKKIFDNFNYNFKKGYIYCILGENGSGKSTLINILIGLTTNYKGNVYYNSINVRDIDLYYAREKLIGITEQEPMLMNDTIKNNITYGLNNISDLEINKWCERFNIYELICTLPNGLDSNIVEQSNNISGGEKQKISLIRTLIKNTNILVLDEPTSALDISSVKKFKELLKELKKDKIIIIVTHNEKLLDISDYKINLSSEYAKYK